MSVETGTFLDVLLRVGLVALLTFGAYWLTACCWPTSYYACCGAVALAGRCPSNAASCPD